jgi:hypothetical protein
MHEDVLDQLNNDHNNNRGNNGIIHGRRHSDIMGNE